MRNFHGRALTDEFLLSFLPWSCIRIYYFLLHFLKLFFFFFLFLLGECLTCSAFPSRRRKQKWLASRLQKIKIAVASFPLLSCAWSGLNTLQKHPSSIWLNFCHKFHLHAIIFFPNKKTHHHRSVRVDKQVRNPTF